MIDGTKPVNEYETVEELYLAGLRVDQFNNARLDYMDFYNEALRRDPGDARVNIEVGKHYIRQAEWAKAEEHLLRAKGRLEHDYTRAYNTEADYYLGYVYSMTGKVADAEDNLWAATYTPAFKHPAYYRLAVSASREGDFNKALQLDNESLLTGAHDLQALTLKAYLLRRLGRNQEALEVIKTIKGIDPLDYWSEFERSLITNGNLSFLAGSRPRRSEGIIAVQELLEVASNYLTLGDAETALAVVDEAIKVGSPFSEYPLVYLYRAFLNGDPADVAKASSLSPENNFPFRVEEVGILETLERKCPNDSKIPYYLGNLLYYLGQKDRGLEEWHKSVSLDPSFSRACRNVGFGEGQKGNYGKAVEYYEMAIKADPSDPMLLTESDKLCEKAGMDAKARLKRLESNLPTVMKHDDAVMRLLQVYNDTGNYDKAIKIMNTRHFHLWEGGGQIHNIYVASHILKGQSYLDKKKYDKALKEFELATLYPANLEVPAPAGKKVTLESMIQDMQSELDDNYAKFGEDDKAATQKRIEEYRKLLEIIKGR